MAPANPDVQVILGHTGNPLQRDPEYFGWWRKEISGAGRGAECRGEDLGARDGRPRLDRREHPAMGPPHDRGVRSRAGDVRHELAGRRAVRALFEQVDAYRVIIAEAGFSREDQERMLHGNAERLYRI